jgi:single-strand DNA-binding protein
MAGETVLTIVGNLTHDPELRQAGSSSVASFTVASTPRTFDKNSGEWRDGNPLFMRCSAWRDLGDHVAGSLSKGDRVMVTGRLGQRSFEKDGVQRTVVELEVDEVGPSLKYATATVNRVSRNGGGQQRAKAPAGSSDDPWG